MRVLLFTSAFCDPCIRTRAVLEQVSEILPGAEVLERDIVRDNVAAELEGIRSTPTTIVLTDAGGEVFRAEGVPTVNQVLAALARAL
ncbi:MAG: thioredoxin family protein [Terrimesophilobacter sp.]